MSRVTSTAIVASPSGTDPSTVTSGTTWTYGSWVQVIAAASGDLHVAGIAMGAISTAVQFEVEIGIGAAPDEAGIHTVRGTLPNAAGESNVEAFILPIPVGGISNGDRVSVRLRTSAISTTIGIGLLTYSGLSDTDHLTSSQLRTAPAGANSVTVTPSATPWGFSNWFELWSGASTESVMLAIISNATVTGTELEWEIGFGAVSSEVPKTLVRTSNTTAGLGALRIFNLPAGLPIPPNTRVAIRLRKNGTSTTAHSAAMLYLNDTDLNTIELTAFETITVSEARTLALTTDIYLTAFDTITLTESTTLRPSVILLQVADTITLDDDASIPLGTSAFDRIFVRDAVFLSPNTLVIRVHETISVLDSALNLNPNGVPQSIGPSPSAPAGAAGVTDYWLAGI